MILPTPKPRNSIVADHSWGQRFRSHWAQQTHCMLPLRSFRASAQNAVAEPHVANTWKLALAQTKLYKTFGDKIKGTVRFSFEKNLNAKLYTAKPQAQPRLLKPALRNITSLCILVRMTSTNKARVQSHLELFSTQVTKVVYLGRSKKLRKGAS